MPAEPVLLIAADTHLRRRVKELEGDSESSFEQICELGIKHRVPIVVAGDVIDTRKNEAYIVAFVRHWMDRLEREQIPFYFIQGQHDLQYPQPWLQAIHRHPTWLDTCRGGCIGEVGWGTYCLQPNGNSDLEWDKPNVGEEDGYIQIEGIDWTPTIKLDEALSNVSKKTNMLVMHQVCHEFMGSITSPELNFHQIPEHIEYLIVGDFHQLEVIKRRNSGNKMMTIVSPGSTYMKTINEPPEKYATMMYSDGTFDQIKLDTRPFVFRLILEEADLVDFENDIVDKLAIAYGTAGLDDEVAIPSLDVHYSVDIPNVYERIVTLLEDEEVHLSLKQLEGEASTEIQCSSQEWREAADKGLLACLPLVAEEGSGEFRIVQQLLMCHEPAEAEQTLVALREEYL